MASIAASRRIYIVFGLLSALLFGAGAQLARLMRGEVDPVTLAGLLYLGSGTGLFLLTVLSRIIGHDRKGVEAGLGRGDGRWLVLSMLFGAFLAPVLLMFSLPVTPAATAALLLNFEAVSTTIIAAVWAGEPIGKRLWVAVALITTSCLLLTYKPDALLGVSIGALGVILTCTFWGLDNNIVQRISGKDPIAIVMIKGLSVGSVSFLLARMLGETIPEPGTLVTAMAIGFIGFGGIMSVCLVLAIRGLGSSRAASLLSLSPFFGVGFAFLIFADMPGTLFLPAFILMIAGSVLLLTEGHTHAHTHPEATHVHRHRHDELHHEHAHAPDHPPLSGKGYHSHVHHHDEVTHTHPHSPDIHHRHSH